MDGSIPTAEAARFWLACADWGGVYSPVESIDYARRAIDLYGDLGDRLGSCRGWTILAYALMTTGRLDEAKRALQEALQLCEATWPPWHRALVDNTATLVLGQLGEFEAARGHAIAVLGASRLVSSVYDQCTAQTLLIDLDVATGHAAQAAVAASDMLAHEPGVWLASDDGRGLRTLATALMSADRLDEAERIFRDALSRVRRNFGNGAFVLHDVAMLVARRGRIDDAARIYAYAEAFYASQGRRIRFVAQQLRSRLLTLLAGQRTPEQLAQLYDEGRRLTDDEACSLAFPFTSVEHQESPGR